MENKTAMHSQVFRKSLILLWIDAEFTVTVKDSGSEKFLGMNYMAKIVHGSPLSHDIMRNGAVHTTIDNIDYVTCYVVNVIYGTTQTFAIVHSCAYYDVL